MHHNIVSLFALMKEVTTPDGFPSHKHFYLRIFQSGQVDIPGDERSRTNPGHGYPGYTINYDLSKHYVTEDQSLFEAAIQMLMAEDPQRKDILALVVERRVSITTQFVVGIR